MHTHTHLIVFLALGQSRPFLLNGYSLVFGQHAHRVRLCVAIAAVVGRTRHTVHCGVAIALTAGLSCGGEERETGENGGVESEGGGERGRDGGGVSAYVARDGGGGRGWGGGEGALEADCVATKEDEREASFALSR